MDEESIQDLIKQLSDTHDPFARNEAAETLKDAAENGLDITSAVPALVKTLSLELDEIYSLNESDRNASKKAGCIPLVLLYDTKNYTDLRLSVFGTLWRFAEKTADKGDYDFSLSIIKDSIAVIIKFYSGKKDRDSLKKRRQELTKLGSLTQQIYNKMNPDKKKFPVKRQDIRKQEPVKKPLKALHMK